MSKKKRPEWKSVKVKGEVYKDLKSMGKGIGKALEVLVAAKKKAVEKKLANIEEMGTELADIMMNAGVFDIKFREWALESAEEEGNIIHLKGHISIEVPDAEARRQIIEVISSHLGEEEAEEEEGEKEKEEKAEKEGEKSEQPMEKSAK